MMERESNMYKVKFHTYCTAVYTSEIDIPDDFARSEEDIHNYIEEHIGECNVDDLEFVCDLDTYEWEDIGIDNIIEIDEGR